MKKKKIDVLKFYHAPKYAWSNPFEKEFDFEKERARKKKKKK